MKNSIIGSYFFSMVSSFHFLIIIIGNLFIIDVALFWSSSKTYVKPLTTTSLTSKEATKSSTDTCSTACKEEIVKAVANSSLKQTPTTQTTITTSVKENFIPMGSGSSTANNWEDVPGAQAYIDSTAYASIKTVTFEESLYTPTANQTAYARLYNVSDKHPVWNSDVRIDGGDPKLLISSPIKLDEGSKLYVVQMKTQLQARTNLENARIHITTY
jgi:hypothetical protein